MLQDDLNYAIHVINDIHQNTFDHIFGFTNENIKDYFDNFDFKNKDVLSVLASSDQVFDMFLRGAKSIDTFDINPLTKYYFYLKKAAIQALDKEEYLRFLHEYIIKNGIYINNTYAFNKETYKKVSKYLDGDNYEFWETLYKKFDDSIFRGEKIINTGYSKLDVLKKETLYLSDNNYELLKENINNLDINFTKCNLIYLLDKLKSKYDIMYFSTIASWLYNLCVTHATLGCDEFIKLLKNFSKYLNQDGIILANYFYSAFEFQELEIDNNKIQTIKFDDRSALIYRK